MRQCRFANLSNEKSKVFVIKFKIYFNDRTMNIYASIDTVSQYFGNSKAHVVFTYVSKSFSVQKYPLLSCHYVSCYWNDISLGQSRQNLHYSTHFTKKVELIWDLWFLLLMSDCNWLCCTLKTKSDQCSRKKLAGFRQWIIINLIESSLFVVLWNWFQERKYRSGIITQL